MSSVLKKADKLNLSLSLSLTVKTPYDKTTVALLTSLEMFT